MKSHKTSALKKKRKEKEERKKKKKKNSSSLKFKKQNKTNLEEYGNQIKQVWSGLELECTEE